MYAILAAGLVILLVLLVQVLQTIGTKLAIHSDKRLKK